MNRNQNFRTPGFTAENALEHHGTTRVIGRAPEAGAFEAVTLQGGFNFCQVGCSATFTALYANVLIGLKAAHAGGVITSKDQCYKMADAGLGIFGPLGAVGTGCLHCACDGEF